MARLIPTLAAALALAGAAPLQAAVAPESLTGAESAPADAARLVESYGALLHVSLGVEGLVYDRLDLSTGRREPVSLDDRAAASVTRFLRTFEGRDPERAAAEALAAYFVARIEPELEALAFQAGSKGFRTLTELGKNLLMDILTARGIPPHPGSTRPHHALTVAIGPMLQLHPVPHLTPQCQGHHQHNTVQVPRKCDREPIHAYGRPLNGFVPPC